MEILLHRINKSLARSEINGAAALHRVGGRAALSGVLAFGFRGNFLLAPNIQLPLGERLLVDFSAFGGRGNGVKYPAFGDPSLHILRN